MLGPASFFTFVHSFQVSGQEWRSIAFAYKPPGPALKGAVEELILEVSKGPQVPDAVVILDVAEDHSNGIRSELNIGANELAQSRIKGRVALLHASLSLKKGKVTLELLDPAFRRKISEVLDEIRTNTPAWIESGLRCVFSPEQVILLAPPGYAYQKPSGSRERFFLKPDLALSTSAAVAFVALALFQKLFAGRIARTQELRSVYLDTMAIAPVAYGLRDLLELCHDKQAYLIESFHSYGGMENVKRPLPGTSICLISASTSMSLHHRWLVEKEVGADEVVTLLTTSPIKKLTGGALLAINPPPAVASEGPPQLSIRLMGETFLPEQEPAKKVLLSEIVHGSPHDIAHFKLFAGKGVFDAFRRPPKSGQRVRALYVDGNKLLKEDEFKNWLSAQLLHRVRAATKFIAHQDDSASRLLAKEIEAMCKSQLNMKNILLIPAAELQNYKMANDAGVIICASVVGKGSQLLEISRGLRDKHEGPRLYIVGYQVAETMDELKTLPSNLRHSKDVPHEFTTFGAIAIGSQLAQSHSTELHTYYQLSASVVGLPSRLAKRSSQIGNIYPVGELALLPCGPNTSDSLKIRPGFAYWTPGYTSQACQAEILGTVGVLLQRARENDKVPEERRLSSSSFRHVLLHPENFTRFNDGLLQAALLRNAYPSEIDYRGDYAASDFMKSVILRALTRATEESGEGLLEFLLALALRRLQLMDDHLNEILVIATAAHTRPANLQRAINFLLRPITKKSVGKNKLPF